MGKSMAYMPRYTAFGNVQVSGNWKDIGRNCVPDLTNEMHERLSTAVKS